ncbi:MAG TPA: 4-alpha-glucanotransferase [Pseudonocardia sp.]|uniref:4-alpha-glucanotransferase n=1 Tax=Pseudonocardia sp. TaxID=60912 RepID=UPI002CADEAD4|nr:4-alpha-glucanotransferase [Pseudonocardia sp.]HTF47396.1 4-alpha-glucanotransferase [Pseudonocardia sp.]
MTSPEMTGSVSPVTVAPGEMPEDLERLAAAHGVATSYRDGRRRPVRVDPDVVVRVLGLLEVDAATPADRRRELAAVAERDRADIPPPTLAVRVGDRPRPLPGARLLVPEDADGGERRELRDELPGDLAPGWYRLISEGPSGESSATVVVAPPRLPMAPPTWGWQLQLYALHSARSWGIGDLGDLREFVRWTGRTHGAGAVLLNPLHAPGPTHPVQPSPYTPSSRRFANPLALRIEDLAAYQRTDPATRAEVDALRVAPPGTDTAARIDHDLVWAAKRSALELLWRAEGRPAPAELHGNSGGLRDFATWNALAERHGGRWSRWPAELHDPSSAEVAAARVELAPRVAFHAWVQQQCAEQLAAVRAQARESGMALGMLHDLAVGVDPEGADAWALADVLATGVSVGAPPDDFTPRGQNWGLPPWRPDRLAATGYAAFRDMLRAVLAHADGLRIDHVAGLWRLWWVPPGDSPDRGTYVHYDAEVMLTVLALEAHRAGAVVVGEDLGTVEPEVTEALADQEMLGCAVSWFARDESVDPHPLLPPARWPERAAASLSTHDLPTAAGFLRGEHVRARAELGLLDDVPAEERAAAAERSELLALLRAEGLLPADPEPEPTERAIILAMHQLLARTPCRLKLISPYDVLAEPRQPNLPGTVDEYPNWRLPLPATLDELRADPRVAEVTAAFQP